MHNPAYKIPQSVLVVIYTPDAQVLLIERADAAGQPTSHWQSVTGSKDSLDESWMKTAQREVWEETGFDVYAPDHHLSDWYLENVYDIWPQWLHRYEPGVSRNTERVMGLRVPQVVSPRLNPREHTSFVWLPCQQAAVQCFSASNAEAILMLPRMTATMNA
jgi:dihydroneopterin triphosphate diphosphatase